jgi:hypothetical protein
LPVDAKREGHHSNSPSLDHRHRGCFPDGYKPVLPHEYQFNLDTDAGQLALERSIEFLSAR